MDGHPEARPLALPKPAALHELGLGTVLREYVRQWSSQAGIRGTFHTGPQDVERFPLQVETTLYRIGRTALDMVAQRRASSVDVLLYRRGPNAVLVVEHDGVGTGEGADAPGFTEMGEHARALGGSVEIEPTPAGGSAMLARVPLPLLSDPDPVAVAPSQYELVATVAHELRNSVAPLIFQVRLAVEQIERMKGADEPIPPDWAQNQFHGAEQRLNRLLETLNRLLDISRLSTGRVDLQPEPVNLVRAVRETVSSFEAELAAAHCELTLDERSAPTGWWDRVRLEQICRNLLSNAIRFGAGHPIEVAIDGDTDFAVLRVRDHGVGIPVDEQGRIFDRFERGAEPRHGGFGLGLWVVKNICSAMGGTIVVESTPGDGACFTVTLPRYRTAH